MRHFLCFIGAGLLAGLPFYCSTAADQPNRPAGDSKTASCGTFGTTVQFVKTPSDAARQALKEQKLVLVLHVSGDFEDPDFT